MWWVGEPTKPFLVKAAIHNKNLLIGNFQFNAEVSNLVSTWAIRKTSEELWQEKDKYARTL